MSYLFNTPIFKIFSPKYISNNGSQQVSIYSTYYCEWCPNSEVQFNLEILLCDLLQEAVRIWLS